jgi:alginate O-acetyltransferase complex protein AlgJ
MKSSLTEKVSAWYPYFFLTFILILLLSFVPASDLSLSSLKNNFRWRKELISFYGTFRHMAGDRVYNYVMVGKDGWLYYTGDKSIDNYQKTDPLNRKQIVQLGKQLDSLNDQLKRRGITLLVVIPPNKSTVYPQHMPDEIPVLGKESSLERFVNYMRKNSGTPIIDLRQTLIDASQTQDVYYHTDSHWNDLGSYYGYMKIMEALSVDNPLLAPHPLSDFNSVYMGANTHDLARGVGLMNNKEEDWTLTPRFKVQLKQTASKLSDGLLTIRTTTNADQDLPRLLIFGDSFYNSLASYLEPHFSRLKMIPYTREEGVWSLSWIERENPNIVIIEIVERNLDEGLPMLLNH